MFQFIHQCFILIQLQFCHFIHQTLNITHAKKFTDKRFSLELLKIINVFTSSNEDYWTACCSNSVEHRSTLLSTCTYNNVPYTYNYVHKFTYALRAPPPLAWPSNFVTITEATSTFALKANACIKSSSKGIMTQLWILT